MRICMICPSYPPSDTRGATRYYYELCKKLEERDIYTDVIAPIIDKKEVKTEGKITIHRMPFMEWKSKQDFFKKSKKLCNYLEKLSKTKKIDIISSQHLYSWFALNPGFAIDTNLLSINKNIPNILTIHTDLEEDPDHINNIPIRNLFWDKIICVSNNTSEKVHSLDIEIDRIITSYPGIDTEKFRPGLGKKWLRSRIDAKEKDRIILFAGAISEQKGIPTLLKAFSTASQGKKKIKLLIAAAKSGENKEEFQELIDKTYERAKLLGIGDKTHIHPFEFDEMPLVYNGCDIFVLPSNKEGFGLVYAEAMACALPVIGTTVGGVPEIISNGDDGYLVEPENPVELSKKINYLIRNSKKRIEMGKKGRKKVLNKFNSNTQTEKIIGLFRSCLEKTKEKEIIKEHLAPIDKLVKKLIKVFSQE